MNPRCVLNKLRSNLSPWADNLLSTLQSETHQSFISKSSPKFVLDHVDISYLLSTCGREGYLHLGSSLHASIIKISPKFNVESRYNSRNFIVLWNSLLFMYSKCGKVRSAVKMFDRMPQRDTISWNTMISGFLQDAYFDTGFEYFKRLFESDSCKFDQATLTALLSACDGPEFCLIIKMVHGLVFANGYEEEISVGNALITAYSKCGRFTLGRQVFDEIFERNVITWTAVISGLQLNECYEASLKLFIEMRSGSVQPNSLTYLSSLMACSSLQALKEGQQIHGLLYKLGMNSGLCIESAIMDMYSKSRSIEDAWKIFESAEELDEVSLTVILVGFAQNGYEEEAIQIFMKMVKVGIEIDPNVVSAILGVFGVDRSLRVGQQIHSLIIKKNFSPNSFVTNGLINMYSKCGDLEDSIEVFNRIPQRNSISWNSMIAAFARHGDGLKALELYENMRSEGLKPTDITFLSLLHACSHVGLVEKGMEYFESMTKDHGISPRTEHHSCVVDMLGRAGLLLEARDFILNLPEKNPSVQVWQSLLGACSIHGDSEMGKYAADQLFLASPESSVPYILLANIYSSEGKWRERARTIKRMKEAGVAKETGISWIEVEKKIHSFVAGDKIHPQIEIVNGVLMELFGFMRDEGYVPDKKFILNYLGQDQKGFI